MKIKKNLIGSKVFCPILRQQFLIEEGNEKKYYKLGLDVFEKRKKPKLQKKNDTDKQGHIDDNSINIDGTNND